MAGLGTLGEVCLYVGLVLVLGSTAQYVREGFRQRAAERGRTTLKLSLTLR